jgi:hypothetical protein
MSQNEVKNQADVQQEDPNYNLYSASHELHAGLNDLYKAIDRIQNAVDDAEGHPMADKINKGLEGLQHSDQYLQQLDGHLKDYLISSENALYHNPGWNPNDKPEDHLKKCDESLHEYIGNCEEATRRNKSQETMSKGTERANGSRNRGVEADALFGHISSEQSKDLQLDH